MDVEEIGTRAKGLFDSGMFCAESILQAVAENAGIESQLIPRIATGLCSGVARTKGMCGAVSGAIMALGLIFGRDNADVTVDATYIKIREFLDAFEKQYGSLNCFDITGCDLSTEAGRLIFKESGMRIKCSGITGEAARIAARIIVREGIRRQQ